MNHIRSSRGLEAEAFRNLEVIWLMGKLRSDRKAIARFRNDNPDSLNKVFRDFAKLCAGLTCNDMGLVDIDDSKFKAVKSRDRWFMEKKLQERLALGCQMPYFV